MRKLIQKAVFFLLSFFLVNLLILTNVNASGVYGAGGCVPVYGGGVECPKEGEVLIDKKVQNPKTGIFVDNILPSDPTRYLPKQIVTFQIIVKNLGDQKIEKVTVTDTIPAFIDYMSITPTNDASYNADSRVLTFTVTNLAAGSSQIFDLKARVVHQAALPAEKSIICPINVVTAQIEGRNPDRDESQFCIEKEIVVPSVPSAGPEQWILSIAGLGSSLVAGLKLRKKSI